MSTVTVELRNIVGTEAALGWAGAHAAVVDRPDGRAGGRGMLKWLHMALVLSALSLLVAAGVVKVLMDPKVSWTLRILCLVFGSYVIKAWLASAFNFSTDPTVDLLWRI